MSSNAYTPTWVKLVVSVLLVGLGVGALALLHIIFLRTPDPAEKARLYLEAAKAILQFVCVLLLGAFVAALVKSFEKGRNADKALNDFVVEFLSRLRSLDKSVQDSQFHLRSCGLTEDFGELNPPLTSERVAEYDRQIILLHEAKGLADRLIQDVDTSRAAFSSSVSLENKLKDLSRLLHEVLEEYAKLRPKFPVQFRDLVKLRGLTAKTVPSEFARWSSRHRDAVALVKTDLLPIKASVRD